MTQSKDIITLSFDDSIEKKRYNDESELKFWHFDHVFGRSVKGVSFPTPMVEVGGMRLPCSVEFVKKYTWVTNTKTGKEKRKSSVTKNELFRKMLRECYGKFRIDYVLADRWYSSEYKLL